MFVVLKPFDPVEELFLPQRAKSRQRRFCQIGNFLADVEDPELDGESCP